MIMKYAFKDENVVIFSQIQQTELNLWYFKEGWIKDSSWESEGCSSFVRVPVVRKIFFTFWLELIVWVWVSL